ncbi:hypothetical protein [Arthrobacter sp. RIT-PI-e]|uniref:hypothetical protein n=1 Tax=Arthrobacter sp. RIT-PI-e TaxID=1681197 RepID=UPI000A408155|nr:hypothetical protein [Arthrobacter sp. RIT-PI-e]
MNQTTSDIQDLVDYLNLTGWDQRTNGESGGLWEAKNGDVIAVPHRASAGDLAWNGVIERVADSAGLSKKSIEALVRNLYVDVTEFRAADDILIHGSIPVEAGFSLISTARTLLRTSATTSRGPKALINGNYSRPGERIVEHARFGHTIPGSYILPMLVPISRPQRISDSLLHDPTLPSLYEPEERRATRTMAQALSAIQNRVVDPDRVPGPTVISDLIIAGVSREMVSALHQVVSDASVTTFDASFRWASGFQEPQKLPSKIEIPAGAARVLKSTFELMRPLKKSRTESLTGQIVQLRDDDSVVFGDVSIRTMRNGRTSEIDVRLRGHELQQAHRWFEEREVLVVEGEVESMPGKGLRIDAPIRVEPLTNTLLFDG